MTESSPDPKPDLANAQVTGGGGHEPDLTQTQRDDEEQRPAATPGAGVDMKSEGLSD